MRAQAHEKGTSLRPAGLAEKDTRHLPDYDQARPSPSPPLPAGTAFLFATLAAAIGLLALVARRVVRVVSGIRGARFRPARCSASPRAMDAPSRSLRVRRREYARSTRVVRWLAVVARALTRMPRGAVAPAIAVATRARTSSFHVRISHQAREDLTFYVLTVVLCVAVGYFVAFGVG